jgi:hypothetical protein
MHFQVGRLTATTLDHWMKVYILATFQNGRTFVRQLWWNFARCFFYLQPDDTVTRFMYSNVWKFPRIHWFWLPFGIINIDPEKNKLLVDVSGCLNHYLPGSIYVILPADHVLMCHFPASNSGSHDHHDPAHVRYSKVVRFS